MRNYEFVYSIKSRDITQSIALFKKYLSLKTNFLNVSKIIKSL